MTETTYLSAITSCYFDSSVLADDTTGKDCIAKVGYKPMPPSERKAMFFQDDEMEKKGVMEVQLYKVALMSVSEYERLKLAAGEPVT